MKPGSAPKDKDEAAQIIFEIYHEFTEALIPEPGSAVISHTGSGSKSPNDIIAAELQKKIDSRNS